MKTKEFKKYLDKAKKVIDLKSSLRIAHNVKFADNKMIVSNLLTEYHFENEVFNGLSGLVDFDKLHRIISKLKDCDFKLVQNSEKFTISTSKCDLNLTADLNIQDFPVFEYRDFSSVGNIKSEHLPLIKRALNYASNDYLRPVMQSVFLDKDNFIVASNAHFLCYYACNNISSIDIMLRPEVAVIMDFESEILQHNDFIKFYSKNETIIQQNIDGKYPQWRLVIPQDQPNILTMSPKELFERLDLAMLTCNKYSGLVKLDLSENECKIISQDLDHDTSFTSKLPSVYTGESMSIGFKNELMQKIIKTENFDKMVIKITDPSRAMTINDCIILTPMMLN